MVFSDQEIPFFAAKRRSSLTKINNPEALGQQRLQVLAGGMQKSGGSEGGDCLLQLDPTAPKMARKATVSQCDS